jgi:hypothetical protein
MRRVAVALMPCRGLPALVRVGGVLALCSVLWYELTAQGLQLLDHLPGGAVVLMPVPGHVYDGVALQGLCPVFMLAPP